MKSLAKYKDTINCFYKYQKYIFEYITPFYIIIDNFYKK